VKQYETLVAVDDAIIEEDLLVEEISIDGMCGVY
jgi:mycofactocin precursor